MAYYSIMIYIPRIIIAAVVFALDFLVGTLACLIRPFHPTNCWMVGRLVGKTLNPVLGINHRIYGKENLSTHQPCIFISNHQDNFDVAAFGAVIPKRTVSLGKKSIKYIPFFGQFYWLAGNIMIDRKNSRKAINSMGIAAEAITKKNTSIWIMPEGTRSRGRGVMKFKKGAFYTAIQAQCAVVPIACSSNHLNINLNKIKAGHIWVKVLDPIETKGMTTKDAEDLSIKCHDLIKNAVANLDEEIATERKLNQG